jgi:hypothetical protein
MATDSSSLETRHDRRGSLALNKPVTSSFDPALDQSIRQLFEQQAEIQAKLAALLPVKYVPNSKLELSMLRLKLRALEAYAQDQSQSPLHYFPPKNNRKERKRKRKRNEGKAF